MEDYFKNSKYKIQELEEGDASPEIDTEQSMFEHSDIPESQVRFFNSHPKQILEDGSKIFNHRRFERDLGIGSFSQTYCLSEVISEKDLSISEETRGVQTYQDQSPAPQRRKIALRVYNTVTLINQRRIDYETMEWTNNLQRLVSEVHLWLQFAGKSPHLCELYAIYEATESEKVYLEIELGDVGLAQKFDEDERTYKKNPIFVHACSSYFSDHA